ncbi:hypothetical protein ASPZODRAFT_1879839 [Penicilliopsis zonata CBS 506.65]|uniref:G-protein coupled receptors family 2 profile 2 domain-containing protein n=1 Tax=Penicilliopsis zonata CBS 506.65 TaxID=1073090 RepID=A0A1L9SIJ7_9EURO|nr:hypothetical protein ASPZODRAFT_1879839 [Penicilliopsis zonata CBS 506.65]OJJ47039.1 hypothetical protein ASPZODRAFT_1879839 [Penicilliopsis zonata CBS 506.65]
MTTNTSLNGLCPEPFLQESLFPTTGGFVDGRYCEDYGTVSCCLPCPLADWRYASDVADKVKIASWIAVGVLPLCVFLLVTYAVVPVKYTHRHYMSICFTLGICFMDVAFIIPLGTNPSQCYNDITPNDMYSDLSCAFTGALLLFGGWCAVVWSLIRTVALHLQVCWEVVLGSWFMWGAFISGWLIPIIGLAIMLDLTGVSYRFGQVCSINEHASLHDYWIPIIVFASIALVMQLTTMVYCIYVYIKSVFDKNPTTSSSALPSYSNSVRTLTARQAYRRVRRVLQLQWRGIALVLIIIGNAIYFAITFIDVDNSEADNAENLAKAVPWLECLVEEKGDRDACMSLAADIGPNEAAIIACMVLLAFVGFWNFILFLRPSMFVGWAELLRGNVTKHHHEFVSADARNFTDARSYEMLNSSGLGSLKTPEPMAVRSPTPGAGAQIGDMKRSSSRNYGYEANYTSPTMSFSTPRPPSSSQQGREWDPQKTYARSHHTRGSSNLTQL